MDNDDNMISVADTPEAAAAEAAAFEAAFADTRQEDAHVDTPAETPADSGPEVEETPASTDEPAAEVPADGEAPATEAPKLFAGLTEEQLAAAIARSGTLQGTVDKMAGRIGQLMQQIEQLRTTPPTTQAGQKALDLKLEKLSSAFPELASMLREDLAGLQGGSGTEALAPAAPAGISQEQLDAAVNARLAPMREQMEVKVLTVVHPDWHQVIRSPQFALWRDNVLGPAQGKLLMESEDSTYISQGLTQFKNWMASANGTPPAAPKVPAAAPKTQSRLANAVLPSGGGSRPATGPVTEEDAFNAAFAKERARSGY